MTRGQPHKREEIARRKANGNQHEQKAKLRNRGNARPMGTNGTEGQAEDHQDNKGQFGNVSRVSGTNDAWDRECD